MNSRDLYITCQILFLSEQIRPQVHIIYALFSLIPTYENIQKYIPYSTILCPVSERYSDVTGHLPGDRQTPFLCGYIQCLTTNPTRHPVQYQLNLVIP